MLGKEKNIESGKNIGNIEKKIQNLGKTQEIWEIIRVQEKWHGCQ